MNPSPVAEKPPIDFVAEAEKIVNNYAARKRKITSETATAYLEYIPPTIISAEYLNKPIANEPKVKQRRRIRHDFVLYALMTAACIAMAVIFAIGWLH